MSPAHLMGFLPGSMSASIIASVREYPGKAAAGLRGHQGVTRQPLLEPEAARRAHAWALGSLTSKTGYPHTAPPSQGSRSQTPSGRCLRSSALRPQHQDPEACPRGGDRCHQKLPQAGGLEHFEPPPREHSLTFTLLFPHLYSQFPCARHTVGMAGAAQSRSVPVGACSPVRQADVKCTHSQLAVQAPMNTVRGGRGSLGVTSMARALIRPGNSGRAADSSHSSGFLPRLHRPSPPDSRPSPGGPLLGSASVPQGTAPPTDALAGQKCGGNTPSHPLQGVLARPLLPTVTNCSDCALGRALPETNPAQPCWPVKTHSLGENVGKPTANTRQHSKSRYEMVSK